MPTGPKGQKRPADDVQDDGKSAAAKELGSKRGKLRHYPASAIFALEKRGCMIGGRLIALSG
ncbi:hypothetical protein P9272_16545 [Mesorhizobium sp. WSM4976]|uniref:hypothetical protein n=1 Tax=Mesorhizobium sp. WSM4976 TaxID=3038549 RepID=UPI002415E2F2|nr:hypothetical protein [Mesorhizobium sp. WSM4976]MDG4895179.1 hypothetical protein [Mesorhizobium sp. WSM4976]